MIYQAIVNLENENESGVLCTVIRASGSTPRNTSSKMLVYADGSVLGTIGGGEMESRVVSEALMAIRDGMPRILEYSMVEPGRGDPGVCGGQMEVYVEPILPRPEVVVVGCGHVGKAVARLAKWLGFRVLASDDRPDFCTPEAIPDANQYLPVLMQDLPERIKIKPWTYFVLTTRGVDIDVPGLAVLLTKEISYIGVIGSQRRWETTRKQLAALGIAEDKLSQVRSPIGLDLGGETPEEIALSIMAEITLMRHGRKATITK
jgi:xanthine dehydrogenase accessory factor